MASTHGPRSEASILNGVTVHLVEDSWHVAKTMKSALEQRGMRVVGPAANTNQARRLAAGERPKLALVDVSLKTDLIAGRPRPLRFGGGKANKLASSRSLVTTHTCARGIRLLQKRYRRPGRCSAREASGGFVGRLVVPNRRVSLVPATWLHRSVWRVPAE